MSARRAAALLLRVLVVVVLVSSAAYLLVYLYRWEWNRALVSGIFVLAAELALIASGLGRRLRTVERTLEQHTRQLHEDRIRELLAAAPAPRPLSFDWLRRPPAGLSVFIPVLLGAGAVLSALAFVVERIAIATADPALQRDMTRNLARLGIPDGGFLRGPSLPPRIEFDSDARRPRRVRLLTWTAIVLAAGLLVSFLISGLANVAMARHEPDRSNESTLLSLEIRQRGEIRPVTETFDLLWGACRSRVPATVNVAEILSTVPGMVDVRLDHGLGRTSARKLGGCLEDAMIDFVQVRILEMEILNGDDEPTSVDPRAPDA